MSAAKRSRVWSYASCVNWRTVSQYVIPEASATTVMPTSRNARMRRSVMDRDISFPREAVTDSEHRFDVLRLGWVFLDLASQVADVLIDRACDAFECGAL